MKSLNLCQLLSYSSDGLLCFIKCSNVLIRSYNQDMFNNFIPDLAAVFHGAHEAVCSLMFFNKLLWSTQKSWIYTMDKLPSVGSCLSYIFYPIYGGGGTPAFHTFWIFNCQNIENKTFFSHITIMHYFCSVVHEISVFDCNVTKYAKFKKNVTFL